MENILHEKIISGVCRLCLSSNGSLIDMFSFSPELGSLIANAVTKCTSVHVEKHRELPSTICEPCYIQLIKTQNFQIQALRSDRTLQVYLQRLHSEYKQSILQNSVILPNADVNPFIETNQDSNTICEETKPDVKYPAVGCEEPEMDIVENKVFASGSKFHTESDEHNKDSAFNPNLVVKAEPLINDNEEQFAFDTEIYNDFAVIQRNIKLENEVSSDKIIKCDACNKYFSASSELIKHKLMHTRERLYQCDVCNKSFDVLATLKRHQRLHTGEKTHQCDVCNKYFSEPGTLKIHQRRHTGEKPYKCDVCNKCFSASSDFRKHHRVHTGLRPYQCDICHKSFSKSDHLKRHQRIHTGEKPYQCERCSKRFTVSSHLQDHIRTHTGEKPHQCDVCNKCFSKLNNLRTHQRIHTGEKPYQCDVCNNCFSQLSGLNSHKRKHAPFVQF